MGSQIYLPHSIKHIPSKRIFDILFSGLVIVLLSPIFLSLALISILSTSSSPIYCQKRVGRGGKLFTCYKFRTMRRGADQELEELLQRDPALKEEWLATRKLRRDPRITRLGRFLRQSSLDELPQFFNVLKGDLSVVGPRAVVPDEIESHVQKNAKEILKIRPGVTGLWQVSGRSDLSYHGRISFDMAYLERRNLLMDLKIVFKTVPLLFNWRGAY